MDHAIGRVGKSCGLVALSLWGALLFATEGQAQATELTGDGSLVAPSAEAPREETYETARGVGMGLGARATAQGTSALAYNAANIGMAQLYHIETMASFVPGDRVTSDPCVGSSILVDAPCFRSPTGSGPKTRAALPVDGVAGRA